MINGLVDKPLVFTMDDLKRMPGRMNRVYFLECAANSGMEWKGAQLNGCQFTHGMIHNVWYTGVPLKALLDEAGVKTERQMAACSKAPMPPGLNRSIPIEKALNDCHRRIGHERRSAAARAGLSAACGGARLARQLWVKWLRRIEVGDEPWQTREETSKYTDLLADGRARRLHLRHGCEIGRHQSVAAGAAEVQGAATSCPASPGRGAVRSDGST